MTACSTHLDLKMVKKINPQFRFLKFCLKILHCEENQQPSKDRLQKYGTYFLDITYACILKTLILFSKKNNTPNIC